MTLKNFDDIPNTTREIMAAPGCALVIELNWQIVEQDRIAGLLTMIRQWPEVKSIAVSPPSGH